MKLLRHILSHLFLISFLIAVVSVFYYRTFLFPANIVGKIEEVANDIYPPSVKFASKRNYFWSIKGERIVSFDDLKLFKKENTSEMQSTETTVPVISSQEITEEVNVAESDKSIQGTKTVRTTGNLNARQVVAETDNPSLLKPGSDAVTAVENESESLPVVVKDSDASSERDLLIHARNAFNQGDMALSEKYYQQLVDMANDEPDIFGELGNVYYAQGKWDKAGQAYYDAAIRLIAEGNTEQIAYLYRVIQGLSTDHAEKLSHMMYQ